MRRRTLHPKAIEPTEKFFILTIDRLQFAIPIAVVVRVLSPSQPIEWNHQSIPTLDFRHLMSDIADTTALQPYTLIIASNPEKPWGLQIPTLPNLLTLPTQSIKEFPDTDTDRSMPHLSGCPGHRDRRDIPGARAGRGPGAGVRSGDESSGRRDTSVDSATYC